MILYNFNTLYHKCIPVWSLDITVTKKEITMTKMMIMKVSYTVWRRFVYNINNN